MTHELVLIKLQSLVFFLSYDVQVHTYYHIGRWCGIVKLKKNVNEIQKIELSDEPEKLTYVQTKLVLYFKTHLKR